ncbi:dTDP-4-dehydrorhamnose reductase [Pelomonas saccharophila]|uniref:dTDP-4-dehydrorhamnose reductase n=1 Tax=Roseateles saccharophilus TaxID=304 RepID=A0ABU1YI18_ROSSA|nr:sugar nucleotide-binding protein [Roseateles saccharophilus]MDR7267686.1 dTDP-4-dehydrorhamnose reductase [Roseateles saccharophilus]
MKILITGLNGTLAPRLAEAARAAGHQVIAWDRATVNPDDEALSAAWLAAQAVDAVAHLGMGSARFAGFLAERCHNLLFTSTAMVFDHKPDGPHDVADDRTARDDYGRYKIDCENAILLASETPVIARIGWQIDPTQPGNNMLMALDGWQQREGRVAASRAWTPACSFMSDTAAALLALIERPLPGVHHLDSNAAEAWRFDELARALARRFGRDWRVEANEDYHHDQRLVGGPSGLPPLSARLDR